RSQLGHRAVADQGLLVNVRGSLAPLAVTSGALLPVNLFAGQGVGGNDAGRHRGQQEQHCPDAGVLATAQSRGADQVHGHSWQATGGVNRAGGGLGRGEGGRFRVPDAGRGDRHKGPEKSFDFQGVEWCIILIRRKIPPTRNFQDVPEGGTMAVLALRSWLLAAPAAALLALLVTGPARAGVPTEPADRAAAAGHPTP